MLTLGEINILEKPRSVHSLHACMIMVCLKNLSYKAFYVAKYKSSFLVSQLMHLIFSNGKIQKEFILYVKSPLSHSTSCSLFHPILKWLWPSQEPSSCILFTSKLYFTVSEVFLQMRGSLFVWSITTVSVPIAAERHRDTLLLKAPKKVWLCPERSLIRFLDGNKLLRLDSLCSRWEKKPSNLLKFSRNDWSTNCLHHTQFRSSLIPQYVMRFTLTIIVIITIIKNKHLLSDEIFMETFQDGEFSMKCRKYQ